MGHPPPPLYNMTIYANFSNFEGNLTSRNNTPLSNLIGILIVYIKIHPYRYPYRIKLVVYIKIHPYRYPYRIKLVVYIKIYS